MVGGRKIRRAVESLYNGVFDVIEHQSFINPDTGITDFNETVVLSGVPGRICYKKINSAIQGKSSDYATQGIILIAAPDIEIKPGSKIRISQNGIITEYQKSGEPAVYESHQEIYLILFKGWI